MTSRERMAVAMRHGTPDRVPVMCQLALGHYFLHGGRDKTVVWHDTEAFADVLIALQRRYGFDGVLVNLPGRDPDWRSQIAEIRETGRDRHVVWTNGWITISPGDDNPHVFTPDRKTQPVWRLGDLDPDRLYYFEPHESGGRRPGEGGPERWSFPPFHWDTLALVRERCPDVSVHGEVFSPFSQFVEMLGVHEAMVALRRDGGKVRACLGALCRGTQALMDGHARAGADAVLVSSAYAGGGFISPDDYRQFVLPCERQVIGAFRAAHPGVPVYTHTCGLLGDRLELLEETGTQGIDTLDPPPLGDVDLADAKARVGGRLFLKGNVDPVNTVLRGTPERCREDARQRIAIAAPGGGYILSTACSVAPHAPPENVRALVEAAEEDGRSG
jgi:uroporphyrinogen-III decarboxylase